MNKRSWQRLRNLLGLHSTTRADQALERAYARFQAAYPEWTASLFDWHFITHRVVPIIQGSSPRYSQADVGRVAQAWAGQWNLGDDLRSRDARRAMSAARGFFTLLRVEMARLPDERFGDSSWQNTHSASLNGQSPRLEGCAGQSNCQGSQRA